VFTGTFVAGEIQVVYHDGALQIVHVRKFVNKVEHVTFSGHVARKSGKSVLYITERCVFRLTKDGLELTEIEPGVDLEKDILGKMDFKPLMPKPLS
jgi:propionate CoA-transferase